MQSTLFNQSVAHPTACRDRSGCLAHSIRLERSVRPRTTCAAQVTGPSLVCSAEPTFAKSYQAESVDCLQQEDSPEQANVCPTCGIDNASRPRGYMCAYHQLHYSTTDPPGLSMIQVRRRGTNCRRSSSCCEVVSHQSL